MPTQTVPETSVQETHKQKFHPGDFVVEDLNRPEYGDEKLDFLVRKGKIIDYRTVGGSDKVQPFILWTDGKQGFTHEENLEPCTGELTFPEVSANDSEQAIEVAAEPVNEDLPARLEAEEHVIDTSKNRMMLSFRVIHEDELWKASGASSFADYCQQRWGIKKSQAYAIAQGGKTIANLLNSGVPESELPTSVSAAEAIAQATPEEQPAVLKETSDRDGSITAAGIKRTLKGKPSFELLKALWAQVGIVEPQSTQEHPYAFYVTSDAVSPAKYFQTKDDAQAAWELEGQKYAALAWRKFSASRELRETLSRVPIRVASSNRNEDIGQIGYLVGVFTEDAKDIRGNQPTPWDYAVTLNGAPYLRCFRLHQLKIDWQRDTSDWMPARVNLEPSSSSVAPSAKQSVGSPPSSDYSAKTGQLLDISGGYRTDDKRGQEKQAIAANKPKLAPFPVGSYSLIVADPPWQYSLREQDASHRGRTPYPTMADEEILTLPMTQLAAEDAYILLWATNAHLPLAFDCLACWGFEYKALHTWVKRSPKTGGLQMGLGHYGRNCTEHFLVGVRGNPGAWSTLEITDQVNVLFEGRREHSRKPEQFWQLADHLSSKLPGKSIELFARERRAGWDSWGLEA